MANIFTASRILLSVLLILMPTLSLQFGVIYLLAGLTDILDGAIARKTDTVSALGAKLDTLADFIFIVACLIKILPEVDLPAFLFLWIGIIVVIKLCNGILYFKKHRKMLTLHTIANKIVGILLFLFPLTLPFIDIALGGSVVCAAAAFAAVHEGITIRNNKDD